MRILNLTEGLRVTEAGIRLSVVSDCNEQRAAAAGHIFMGNLLLCCDKIVKGTDTILVSVSFTISSVI